MAKAFQTNMFPNGVTAPEWERKGNQWEPDIHFTGSQQSILSRMNKDKRLKAPHTVVAYWLYEPVPGFFSLEIQLGE